MRAFERAARLIEDLPEPVDALLDGHRLDLMQGIGESIEVELQALRTTGSSPRHEELIARIGPGVLDLMDIQGLGMKRMQILYEEVGITSIASLRDAALAGRLRGLASFGKAVEQKLLTEIEHWERTRGKRYPLPEAKGLADSIRLQLLDVTEVARAEVGGSIRRGREMIGDIDILVTTDAARTVAAYFKSLPEVTEVISDGDTRASVRVIGGIQVDLRVLEPHEFGAGLHYFTGSKDHHIQMRLRSKRLGLKISEHGVCRHDDPREVPVGPMDTEEEVFAAVDLDYIAPEIRAGKDEIDAAEVGSLPKLVGARDLRGDVHVHTNRTGGRDSVDDLCADAAKRGYEWLVVSERSRGLNANGLTTPELADWIEQCGRTPERHGVRVLCGVETMIRPDGMFDVDHRLLARCDWVVATLDPNVGDDTDANTQAVIWAVETGLISCLASPTGRRLGVHDGAALYFDEIVDACIDFGVALEMNGHPTRLDLNAQQAARARKKGALLVAGSEAGSVSAMSNIDYAVQQARRAWFEPRDLLNCLPAESLLKRVRRLVG